MELSCAKVEAIQVKVELVLFGSNTFQILWFRQFTLGQGKFLTFKFIHLPN